VVEERTSRAVSVPKVQQNIHGKLLDIFKLFFNKKLVDIIVEGRNMLGSFDENQLKRKSVSKIVIGGTLHWCEKCYIGHCFECIKDYQRNYNY
jgi:hypothetical protein